MPTKFVLAAVVLAAVLYASAADVAWVPAALGGTAAPLGLPPLPGEPSNAATVALGKRLFFERRLSFNDTMSCGMCHVEKQAFTSNELATSVGMEGKGLRRNAPSLFNVVYETSLFRDGRENALETQIWSPILSPDEIAAPSAGWVLAKLRGLPDYAVLFEQAFPGRGVTMDTMGAAIAAYERSLLLADSRFDRWRYGGEEDALSPQERAGYDLFTGKAGCALCHQIGEHSALFTDGKFHDTGLGYAHTMGLNDKDVDIRLAEGNVTTRSQKDLKAISSPTANDLGRFEVTQDPKDRWAFKTPSLRNVALTAPYMHDGSIGTLEDMIAYYNDGGRYSPNKSELIKPLNLSEDEKQSLVAFLKALTGTPH